MKIPHIVADYRERTSTVPQLLEDLGVKVSFRNLTIGDYILSENHVIERKGADDFVSSLISGRLFSQFTRLTETYSFTLLIVEGDFPAVVESFSNPRSLWGALASLSLSKTTHVFFTPDKRQTANLIQTFANQVGTKKAKGPIIKDRPKIRTVAERQLSIVSTLPGIGPMMADKMLKKFGSVRRIFTTSSRQLSLVERLGKTRADKIAQVLDEKYESSEKEKVPTL
ncbi:MAG: ERCC4 domain-containing protein, partial [Candidatus Bathyarchaeia archaeon]